MMTEWCDALESALSRFGDEVEMNVECLPAPHQPSKLPDGKMAVFGFYLDDECLLISYCGPNSNARYQSQHYSLHGAPSTRAKKLANDADMNSLPGFSRNAPGGWIKQTTNRFNILVDADENRDLLIRLKEHLVDVLQPRYAE